MNDDNDSLLDPLSAVRLPDTARGGFYSAISPWLAVRRNEDRRQKPTNRHRPEGGEESKEAMVAEDADERWRQRYSRSCCCCRACISRVACCVNAREIMSNSQRMSVANGARRCVCLCICLYVCMAMCVCLAVHVLNFLCIHMYMSSCFCMHTCMCLFVRM